MAISPNSPHPAQSISAATELASLGVQAGKHVLEGFVEAGDAVVLQRQADVVHVDADGSQPAHHLGGLRYGFSSWSDGGAAAHDVTARNGQTYTATYAPVSTDIKVTKTFTRSAKQITFTITVAHVKGITAQAVVMTDTLVSRLTYVSSTTNRGTCTRAGQKVTCSIGTLGFGQTVTIKVVANVNNLMTHLE